MSAKDQREAAARAAHKAQLRRQTPVLRRAAPTREENPVLLILCQGEVTEVEYFEHFELATATIRAVGQAYDPEKLVQYALELREEARQQRQPYEQVWCVFDKDDTRPGNFQTALDKAAANGVEAAYSNQAFEFWLLLHFDDHAGGGMSRKSCGQRLQKLITAASPRVFYNPVKGKHVSRDLFDLLEANDPSARTSRVSRREVAMRRAEAIDRRWEADGTAPSRQESTTRVYRLVQVLQRHLPARPGRE